MAHPIDYHVSILGALDEDGKQSYLQRIVGGITANALELDWRAKLFSALRVAGVWPHRVADGDWANDDDGA